ncbi:MAG: TonB family protein [Bacteroidales bacterium]|nr:TonB family protein [Bacteroidales bacterium]
MKNYILLIFCLLTSIGIKSQDLVLLFDFNSDILSVDSKTSLNEYATDLKLCDSVLLIGHTDTVGNPSYNDELSYERAISVQNWMIKNSIKTKIILESKGEKNVFDPNNDSLNRRVELIAFYHSKKFPKKEVQEFYIDNTKDTTLYGNEGTLIKIPANSIWPKSSTNKFKIVFSDYYSNTDIIFNKLTTRTDSEILETGGMINIEIFDNEVKCSLKENIQIGFPVQSVRNNEMEIFQGVEDNEGYIIWRQNSDEEAFFTSTSSTFVIAEEMPEFQGGGLNNFQRFIQSNITYPQVAIDSGYCGRVFVSFIVGSDGSITNARIVRGSHSSLNAEALRVVSQAPKWTPGRQRGQNVPVQMTFPINFMLDDDCVFVVDTLGSGGEFYSIVNDSTFEESSVEQINYYIFNTLALGWINCDWYGFRDKPKTNQKVIVKGLGDLSTHLIFSEYNVVLSGSKYKDYFIFNGTPKNEKIRVLGIKRIGEKVFFVLEKTTVSSQAIKLDNFTEITFDDLKQKLDDLKRNK